ncbi:MAG: SMP-30/gluconolactonase/LRE family protein [Alphaproteobacteria bacterium]|nr:SMP-30/gluconolactonase/LRE family protein [Alphaproteobacteria bacterium]
MKFLFGTALTLFLVLAAYLLFWPVPIEPVAWDAPTNKGYVDTFAPNERLATPKLIDLDGHTGPEDATLGPDGLLYVSTHDGTIVRVDLESGKTEEFARTDGRPLGMEFGSDGRLYVSDAFRGLMAVEQDGKTVLLSDRTADGSPIRYANDLDITRSGLVYFSDASTKFGAREFGGTYEASLLDLMEHGPNGRVLKYDPKTGQTDVVIDGLSFANGVALAEDDSFLLISETGTYSVLKYWLAGDKAGGVETIIQNLPGFPDNLNRIGDGSYWLGLVSPRSAFADALSEQPFLRKVVQRLPASLRPKAQRYGFVVRLDGDGTILETIQAPQGFYALTTGATPGPNGELVVTSLTEPRLGYLEAGWEE